MYKLSAVCLVVRSPQKSHICLIMLWWKESLGKSPAVVTLHCCTWKGPAVSECVEWGSSDPRPRDASALVLAWKNAASGICLFSETIISSTYWPCYGNYGYNTWIWGHVFVSWNIPGISTIQILIWVAMVCGTDLRAWLMPAETLSSHSGCLKVLISFHTGSWWFCKFFIFDSQFRCGTDLSTQVHFTSFWFDLWYTTKARWGFQQYPYLVGAQRQACKPHD